MALEFEYAVRYDSAGKEAFNIGYGRVVDGVGGGLFDVPAPEVADALALQWTAQIMPSLSNNTVFEDILVKSIDGVAVGTSTVNSGTPGAQGGNQLPVNNALVIKRSDIGSRRGGRWFLPGVPEDECDDQGRVDSAWASNLAAQFAGMDANLNALTGPWTINLLNRHKTAVPNQFTYDTITGYSYNTIIGSQRDRRF